MQNELKQQVLKANLELPAKGLVVYTWGNVSAIDRKAGLVVIKASGIPYEAMTAGHMVVTDLDGKVLEGDLRPSSDLPTHLELYKHFPEVGGIVHTHSTWATIWSQAGRGIPVLGTTHADYFYGEIPCTRTMTAAEIEQDYEANTGSVIVETFQARNPSHLPGVLVNNHGPFSWGKDAAEAVHNGVVLEALAQMAYFTLSLNPQAGSISPVLLDKHFLRKHGTSAYYGQR